jgi:hypothetical protein
MYVSASTSCRRYLCILRVLGRFFVPALAAASAAAATPVYRVLDVGAGTSGTTARSRKVTVILACNDVSVDFPPRRVCVCVTNPELPFNLYEALSTESKRIGRPFRVELWSVDFARTVRTTHPPTASEAASRPAPHQ